MKRRLISQLPAINQTKVLERFFGATADHLFQPGKTSPISGFIGRIPEYDNPGKDFYKPEPTPFRTRYQLEAAMVSIAPDKSVQASFFYDDLIARLGAAGALVDDTDRLFSSKFWAWAPPIDIDKVSNFHRYYWSDTTVIALDLVSPGIERGATYDGDGVRKQFPLPPTLKHRRILDIDKIAIGEDEYFDGCPVVLVNRVRVNHTIVGDNVVLDTAPPLNASVVVLRYGNVGDGVRTQFPIPEDFEGAPSSYTIRVYLNGVETTAFTINSAKTIATIPNVDANTLVTVVKESDLKALISGEENFPIEGLNTTGVESLVDGMRVRIVDATTAFNGFDFKPADTFPWDEWVDEYYLIEGVGDSIEFLPESEEYISLQPIYTVNNRYSPDRSYWSRINRWVTAEALEWNDQATAARRAKRPIIEFVSGLQLFNYGKNRIIDIDGIISGPVTINGSPISVSTIVGRDVGSIRVDETYILAAGDHVLFARPPGSVPQANKIYLVDVDNQGKYTLTLAATPVENDITRDTTTGKEYWFNGTSWIEAAQPGDFPLFDLFDAEGISIGDPGIYPDSTFTGSRIFSYALSDNSKTDTVLGFAVQYDNLGQIMFENDLYTRDYSYRGGEIIGYKYYRVGDNYANQWYLNSNDLPTGDDIIVPLNLQANPNFESPTFLSRNMWFEHFSTIMKNQDGFEGEPYSDNNWATTARDLSLGTKIVQSRSPLLKLMLLMGVSDFDLRSAIKFTENEFVRFKLKVRQKIKEFTKKGKIVDTTTAADAVDAILFALNTNRSKEFPFFNSSVGGSRYFIPPTPAVLGITSLVRPKMRVEKISGKTYAYLVGHDGSMTVSVDPQTDAIMLEFEKRIFFSCADRYKAEIRPTIDEADLLTTKFHEGLYSRVEELEIFRADFENWVRINNADYLTNSTFDANDRFTWNYSEMSDRDGDPVPGNWRGMYRWFCGTEMPNHTPWEMLGFVERPEWWTAYYGPGPYGRINTQMWDDIEAGIIKDGPRAGTDTRYARPDLMNYLPIDYEGNLLDPVTAGLVPEPTIQQASRGWIFGDYSPIESLWRRSSSYGFAVAYALFLMRPAQFVEDYWDNGERTIVHGTQWVDSSTMTRASNAELVIHGELRSDGSVKESFGIQNWIVEYMIGRGQSPAYMGDMVRGLDVRLAHKMAGFTTKDRMTITAENFGLIPDEDITIALYQSPDVSVDFYSGMLIEYTGLRGYRVIGFNSTNPYFDTIELDTNGRRIRLNGGTDRVVNPWSPNVYYKMGVFVEFNGFVYECAQNHTSSSNFEEQFWVIDSDNIVPDEELFHYTDTTGAIIRVPYTTIYKTRQEVINFIFSYEEYLKSRGFQFNDDQDWAKSVADFINWSKIKWSEGSFLALSPAAREINYETPNGYILDMESSGSILNRTGHSIDGRKTKVDRLDGHVTITCDGDDIYGVALHKAEIEHILIFSNSTIFGDLIYNPLLNLRQPRLKMSARRTSDWVGRYDAPGFIITDGQIVPNFEKSAEDLRYMFDIELADNTVLRDHARHLIGFQNREYLDGLLLNETQQFELYQGMIQQKGTPQSLNKILRSDSIEQNRDLQFLEEWAFRVGDFGANEPRGYFELSVNQNDIRRENQIINLNSAKMWEAEKVYTIDTSVVYNNSLYACSTAHTSTDIFDVTKWSHIGKFDWLQIGTNDHHWVSPRIDFSELVGSDLSKLYGLPDAGYVRPSEVNYIAPTLDVFTAKVKQDIVARTTDYEVKQSVWIYNYDNNGWNVLYLGNSGAEENNIVEIQTASEDETVIGTRIIMNENHNINVGDLVLIGGGAGADLSMAGVHVVSDKGADWFEIDTETNIGYLYEDFGETGPIVFKLTKGRVTNMANAISFPIIGVNVYVDHATFEDGKYLWGVFKSVAVEDLPGVINKTDFVRNQPSRINNTKVASSLIYDQGTEVTDTAIKPKPLVLSRITPLDPLIGMIPGIADKEIDYKLEYDPAAYDGENTRWGDDQVGILWWDISTVWYLNYYSDDLTVFDTDSARYIEEIEYRATNWGKLAPYSSVDIYEWTKSTVNPEGTVTNYITSVEFNTGLAKEVTTYYYWVKNPATIPSRAKRKLDARSCADIISNPTRAGLPWMAVIAPETMIVSGVRDYLNDNSSVIQLQLQLTNEEEAKSHQQWYLMRPNDSTSLPPRKLWDKMIDSLVGFDTNMKPIPSADLNDNSKIGIAHDQSMFAEDKRNLGRQSLVTMINYILSRHNLSSNHIFDDSYITLSDSAPEVYQWTQNDVSTSLAPLPPKNSYDLVAHSKEELEEILAEHPTSQVLLDNRFGSRPSWSVWELENNIPVLAKPYDFVVSDITDIDVSPSIPNALVDGEPLVSGDRILVRENSQYNDFWTISRYDGLIGGIHKFTIVDAQKYRTSDFWNEIDWFDPDFDVDEPVVVYDTLLARNQAENPSPANLVVKIKDDGTGHWVWTAWIDGSWRVIARQNGTIELSTKLYTNTAKWGFDGTSGAAAPYRFTASNAYNRDGSFELRYLVQALIDRRIITDLEYNELWFSMVNCIHALHDEVTWIFKTSFLSILGYNERLTTAPVAVRDNSDFLVSYLNEVKPYRVTVRDFSRSLSPDVDEADITGSDFDKPGYFDENTQEYRRLNPNNATDLAIMENGLWSFWLDNIEKRRKFDITMKFDRIWTTATNGSGAASRIASFYHPTADMRPNDLRDLLDLDFKGTILDGRTMKVPGTDIIQGDAVSDDIDINGEGGYALRDPHVEKDHPEELVSIGSHDVFLLRAHDRWGAGAPKQLIRNYDVSRSRELKTRLDIGMIPRDIAVFFDGVRGVENIDYTINHLDHHIENVLLVRGVGSQSVRTKAVVIHAFGYAGHTTIIEQTYDIASSTSEYASPRSGAPGYYDFSVPLPASVIAEDEFYAEVTNNGRLIHSTIDDDNINYYCLPGEKIIITYYKGSNVSATRMHIVSLTYNSAQVWNLDKTSMNRPFSNSMMVEVNGLRLRPPHSYYTDNINFVVFPAEDASKLWVYDNNGIKLPVTVVDPEDYVSIEDIINADILDRYVFWNGTIVFRDGNAEERSYIVIENDSGDYMIDDNGVLTISKQLDDNDQIRVTHWRNDVIMNVRSWSFNPELDGSYRMMTRSRNFTWLTQGGKRLVENVHYSIAPTALGAWDIEAYDTFGFDDMTEVEILLKNIPSDAEPDITDTTVSREFTYVKGTSEEISSDIPARAELSVDPYNRTAYLAVNRNIVQYNIQSMKEVNRLETDTHPIKILGASNRVLFQDTDPDNDIVNGEGVFYSALHINSGSLDPLLLVGETFAENETTPPADYQDQSHILSGSGENSRMAYVRSLFKQWVVNMANNRFVGVYELLDGIFATAIDFNDVDPDIEFDGFVIPCKPKSQSCEFAVPYHKTGEAGFVLFEMLDNGTLNHTVVPLNDGAAVKDIAYQLNDNSLIIIMDADEGYFKWSIEDEQKVWTTFIPSLADEDVGVCPNYSPHTGHNISNSVYGFVVPGGAAYMLNLGSGAIMYSGHVNEVGTENEYKPTFEAHYFDGNSNSIYFINSHPQLNGGNYVLGRINLLAIKTNADIVVTTFEGPQNSTPLDWQLSTTTPDIIRYRRFDQGVLEIDDPEDIDDRVYIDGLPVKLVQDSIRLRPYLLETKSWAIESFDKLREGGLLIADIDETDDTFSIEVSTVLPEIMVSEEPVIIPDAESREPGVIWIDAERIEYFAKAANDGVIEITQLRRGTRGTPRQKHLAGSAAMVQHPLYKIPRAPKSDIVPAPIGYDFDDDEYYTPDA